MKTFLVLTVMMIAVGSTAADRIVRLHGLTDCTVESLLEEGYDVTSVNRSEGFVDIMIDERDMHTLEGKAADTRVLPLEWSQLLPENAYNAGYYYSPEENWAFWCNQAVTYPDLSDTPVTVGQSFENRDVYVIRMTSTSGPIDKPAILFSSLIHAREPGSNSVIIDFAMWLSSEYGSDTMATFILDNSEVYFMPIVNPDGYVYNMPGGGGQRKNMNFTVPVPSDGIDLNRNFGYMWGHDNVGSSPNPYSETYRGESAFSELETQIVRDFTNDIDPLGAMHNHTYGEMLMYPWGYTTDPTPDAATFAAWTAQMTEFNGYAHGQVSTTIYLANGDSNDWSYGDTSGHPTCMAMVTEVGDNGFWGGQNDTLLIEAFCADCRYINILFCMNLLNMVGVSESADLPLSAGLSITGISPNPVAGSMSIAMDIPDGPVEICVFDLTGRMIGSIDADGVHAGNNLLNWFVPGDVPNGVYVVRAVSGNTVTQTRFTLLR